MYKDAFSHVALLRMYFVTFCYHFLMCCHARHGVVMLVSVMYGCPDIEVEELTLKGGGIATAWRDCYRVLFSTWDSSRVARVPGIARWFSRGGAFWVCVNVHGEF